jgi:hypothetical protein
MGIHVQEIEVVVATYTGVVNMISMLSVCVYLLQSVASNSDRSMTASYHVIHHNHTMIVDKGS